MSVIIRESELSFGKYDEADVFHIEKSPQYIKVHRHGVKSCEFILKRGNQLYLVEAKSSCPRLITDGTLEERKKQEESFRSFIEEVALKMRHSLLLYGNILLRKKEQAGVPVNCLLKDLSDIKLQLILVINTNKGDWKPAPELHDALQRYLRIEMRLWKIPSFLVLSARKAREKQLLVTEDA